MILQTLPNNKLLPAAFFFFIIIFLFFVILKISLTIVLLYFLNKTKNWFLIALGSYHNTELVETDTKSNNKQRKVCTKKTYARCGNYSKLGQPLVFCKEGLRDWFARFHSERLYDLQSSISQQSCNSPE